MIVVDENIQNQTLRAEIASWYRGQVISILSLRPATLIHDDGIATLLRHENRPTFVTINVVDFWRRVQANPAFCIVTIVLPQDRSDRAPEVLRRLLRLAEFRTKALRMGKVIRVRSSAIEYYASDRQIHEVSWPGE